VKIVFLCPSLEAGRDGVGDYTRRLASECTKRGHLCLIIGLHDPHIISESEASEDGVSLVRLPAAESWTTRVKRASMHIRNWGPEWVSWQFVSYGFHPKGLVPEALRELAMSLRGPRCHIMLHELWIGLEADAPGWPRVVGEAQRWGLSRLLRDRAPDRLHTSNRTYQAELARRGFAAELLELFGNVPLAPADEPNALTRFIPSAAGTGRENWIVGVTFGTLHRQWKPAATIEWLLANAGRLGRQPALIAIGRIGSHQAEIVERFSEKGINVIVTGEQDPRTISSLFSHADFGIAPHPWALIGKSGAAAGMLEHGLPVLVPRDDWKLRDVNPQPVPSTDPLLKRLEGLDADATDLWLASRRPAEAAVPKIAAEFLRALGAVAGMPLEAAKPQLRTIVRPMNFLFYVPQMAPYGGIERHVCGLARVVAERGHKVTLLTTSNSLGADLRTELVHPSITFRELPLARGSAGAMTKIAWLLNEVRRSRSTNWDVIYTNGQSALSRIAWLAARRYTRIVHHHHTAADAREQAAWSDSFRRVLQRAPILVGCSNATKNALNDALDRTDARFLPYLTRCALETSQVVNRPAHRPLRFGFSGRLIPEKGIDTILALASEPGLPNLEWHIHGAGEAYPPERFAGLPRLVYHGAYSSPQEHATAMLQLDAAVLFSTHNEGMPLSLIEAMSAGLPWIATDQGGTKELAISRENTVVAPAQAGISELVSAVRSLAGRITAGETSRVAQRAAYDQNFAPPVVAARWLDFFETRI
jgi:glycosyltransferase involved in cell wall biosynthesis